eukprot:CAMPEP_0117682286 /NCGR_PEP_ID=MMETSP0804-20121206/19560_1 /TAXON_ID=1074897 /ORGANISM="Tetraselmis astigmatica, Strain CCMP880" /LENGTH=99 /DNA_ID=CAMNT_0005492351 /DNA_START=283 /DNA_END=578 /DNA_ORIENTATION=+
MASSEEVEQLREACHRAEEETAAVRLKLRNAVKKGKAIDEERLSLQRQLDELLSSSAQQQQEQQQVRASAEELAAIKASAEEYREKLKNAVRKGRGIEG